MTKVTYETTDRRVFDLSDSQVRRERRECDIWVRRISSGRYQVSLVHDSDPGVWEIWRSGKRWYGSNDEQPEHVIDAATFANAKMDLRYGYFA